jgi:hypothetical protein
VHLLLCSWPKFLIAPPANGKSGSFFLRNLSYGRHRRTVNPRFHPGTLQRT